MFSLVLSASRRRCLNAPRNFGSSARQLTDKPKTTDSSNRPKGRKTKKAVDKVHEKEKYLARWDAEMKAQRTWNTTIIRGTDAIYDTLVDLLSSLTTYNPFMFHPSSRIRDSRQSHRKTLPNWLSPKVFVPPVEKVSPIRDDIELIAQITGRPWVDVWNSRCHGSAPTHSLDEFVRYAEQNPDAVIYPILIVREEKVVSGMHKILRTIREWKQDAEKRERHELERLKTHETEVAEKEVELRTKLYRQVYGPGTTFYRDIGEKVLAREKRKEREKEKNAGLFKAAILRRQMRA
ncbi:uncharacterized protein EV420DRAFT_1533015 [Desarmillaria tabescens]|uniref:Uncharacterized protein n=1 Tax=Armillaria tabescens TaxID=1929756 RepID=A0AA39N7R1_ARMTA|nr:uncharacterized protein EV420DRAFT_1533015 [Desarmillaria tabescens]KAK0460576.1 hypothetical protein EV420DRAFT_1533015 [Desarmillaria tabescens]